MYSQMGRGRGIPTHPRPYGGVCFGQNVKDFSQTTWPWKQNPTNPIFEMTKLDFWLNFVYTISVEDE